MKIFANVWKIILFLKNTIFALKSKQSKKMIGLIFFLCSVLTIFPQMIIAQNTDQLRDLSEYINSQPLKAGFAAMDMKTGVTIKFNHNQLFPMQSVYKFHLALAVLDQIDRGRFPLDKKVMIQKRDLSQNTWSPLKDKYPEGNIEMPLSEIISYAVAQSDNNACDLLFRLMGGPSKVQKYLQKSGFRDVSVVSTETEMHADPSLQFRNSTSPESALKLLSNFYHGKLLSPETTEFLFGIMSESSTGRNRIKSLMPPGTIVAHKTGTGNVDLLGKITAVNDMGFVVFPDGRTVAIVVLISESELNYEETEKVIAEISIRLCRIMLGKKFDEYN
jgi:beta-lactamase class A